MPTRKPPLGLARPLRDEVYAVTGGQPMKWVMVGERGLRHPHTSIEPWTRPWRWRSARAG